MSTPGQILKDIHRLRRHIKDLETKLEQGPKAHKAHQLKVAQAEDALHAIYETAIERVKTEAAEPVRGTTVQLLKWLDKHHTNVVQIRFGVNSAAEMASLDDFLDEFARERRVTAPLVPIGPSLAPEIWERRQAELIGVGTDRRRQRTDHDRGKFGEQIALHHKGGTRFSIISRRGDGHELSALHYGSGHS